uniref:Uncharacterized protein n=1 Tax=Moniliophthora roreri TaxID=221103 RepID=A0A0W0EZ05_MONRR
MASNWVVMASNWVVITTIKLFISLSKPGCI